MSTEEKQEELLKALKIYQNYTHVLTQKLAYIEGMLYYAGILGTQDLKTLSEMEKEHEKE